MDDDERGKVFKFDPAAGRKKTLNGASPGKGPNKDVLLKVLGTVALIAGFALAYYALKGF
jgi:hypothetical protein